MGTNKMCWICWVDEGADGWRRDGMGGREEGGGRIL